MHNNDSIETLQNRRSSARLRQGSRKNNRDPDFLYEFGNRAASWSDLSPNNNRNKKGSYKRNTSNLTTKLCVSESNVSGENKIGQSPVFKLPSVRALAWKSQQTKYSQQRIDVLLNKASVDKHPGDLLRTETQQDLSSSWDEVNAKSTSWNTLVSQDSDVYVSTNDLFSEVHTTNTEEGIKTSALFAQGKELIENCTSHLNPSDCNTRKTDHPLLCDQTDAECEISESAVTTVNTTSSVNNGTVCPVAYCEVSDYRDNTTPPREADINFFDLSLHKGACSNATSLVVSKDMASGGKNSDTLKTSSNIMEGITDSDIPEWKSFLINMQNSLQASIRNSADDLRTEFKQGLDAVIKSNEDLQTEVASIDKRSKDNADAITRLSNELKMCRTQITNNAGATVKLDQMLTENKLQTTQLSKRSNRDMMRISGLKEKAGESAKAAVDNFLKNILKIQSTISLWEAYHLGKGEYKTVVFQLKNYRDKGIIFSHVKNLKDVVNDKDLPYQVREHLSAKEFMQQKKHCQLFSANKRSTASKLKMSFEKAKLSVNGEPFKSVIKAPSCQEVLLPTTANLIPRLDIQLVKGDVITVEQQEFHGYTVIANNMDQVNAAYARVAADHTNARHVVGACRLTGENWHTLQDYDDNDEHGAGALLLHMLSTCKIYQRAVFVARVYDGSHIGNKRWDAFQKAAESAILAAPFNKELGLHQFPWPAETNTEGIGTSSIRGRGARRYQSTRIPPSPSAWDNDAEPTAQD